MRIVHTVIVSLCPALPLFVSDSIYLNKTNKQNKNKTIGESNGVVSCQSSSFVFQLLLQFATLPEQSESSKGGIRTGPPVLDV